MPLVFWHGRVAQASSTGDGAAVIGRGRGAAQPLVGRGDRLGAFPGARRPAEGSTYLRRPGDLGRLRGRRLVVAKRGAGHGGEEGEWPESKHTLSRPPV